MTDGGDTRPPDVARFVWRGTDRTDAPARPKLERLPLEIDGRTYVRLLQFARSRGISVARALELALSDICGPIARRNRLRAAGRCICGPDIGSPGHGVEHGPPVKGGKCQRCIDAHRRGR